MKLFSLVPKYSDPIDGTGAEVSPALVPKCLGTEVSANLSIL